MIRVTFKTYNVNFEAKQQRWNSVVCVIERKLTEQSPPTRCLACKIAFSGKDMAL